MKRFFGFLLIFLCLASLASAGVIHVIGSGVLGGGGVGAHDYTAHSSCRGAWLFNDNLTDSSGDGNTLNTGNGPTTYDSICPSGYATCGTSTKAAHFDGSDDGPGRNDGDLSANFPGKDGTNEPDFTISCWLDLDADITGDTRKIFMSSARLQIEFTIAEVMRLIVNDGVDSETWTTTFDLTGDYDALYQVIFTFDGSATTGTLWVSSDGGSFGDIIDGVTNVFDNVDYVGGHSTGMAIASYNTTEAYWDGSIYQFAIFNATLSDIGSTYSQTAAEAGESIYTYGLTGND